MPFRPAPRKRKPRRICEALSPLSGRKPAHSWFSAAGEGCERIAENHAFRGSFWPWQQEIHCSKIRLLRVQEISKLRVAGNWVTTLLPLVHTQVSKTRSLLQNLSLQIKLSPSALFVPALQADKVADRSGRMCWTCFQSSWCISNVPICLVPSQSQICI